MIVWRLTLVKADSSQQLKFIIVDCCIIRCKENREYTDRELGETAVSLDPQITVQKLSVPWRNTNSGSRRKWLFHGGNGGISARSSVQMVGFTARRKAHSEEAPQRESPAAQNGGIFSARKAHREETHSARGLFTARKQPHSASAFSGGG
ncbi:Uncharacterized protein Fot_36576 [Forsythia ovata]|uniref:Uncharacterized protein n=1 Tax=Forsythia ovata TaxID=205694 RepID=A0ABD1SPU1_9LAMI